MKQKRLPLIIVFSLLFALLAGIQVYFLQNSYQLKREEIIANVKYKLSSVEDDLDFIDEKILDDDKVLRLLVLVEEGKMELSELQQKYSDKATEINPSVDRYLDSLFRSSGYRVGLQKEITLIRSEQTNDTLSHDPIVIYQSSFPVSKRWLLSSGTWETAESSSSVTTEKNVDTENSSRRHRYFIKRRNYFEIDRLDWLVYRDLAGLMLTSISILGAMLFIFYLTYRNLIRQRKQLQVLHDTIDNISHEMRTPLATLKFASKAIEKSNDPSFLEVIGRQIARLEAVVQPLGDMKPDSSTFVACTVQDIEHLLADFQMRCPAIRIDFDHGRVQNLPLDRRDIIIILDNLLSNSAKYGADRIRLRLHEHVDALEIEVADDGIGIPPNEYTHVFEKYYRIQHNNIHNTKGLGLGLYIVKQIVERYHGRIEVRSTSPQGTIFHLYLPYAT